MDMMQEFLTFSTNIVLSFSALHASFYLFKDHRAPSIGFFLIACSSALFYLPFSGPTLFQVQNEIEWAAEVLCPALSAFGFLWHSEDHLTAHVLLIGSTCLTLLANWLSGEGLVIMTRCLALSSLCCSLTVCLFAGNGTGMLGSVTLSLPALIAPKIRGRRVAWMSSQATAELHGCILKGAMAVGCWMTKRALNTFLQDLKHWD